MAGERDRTEGTWDNAKGKVKEATGKAVNDRDLEAEGKRDQVKGGVEKASGKVKDAAEDFKEGIKKAMS
ncbi:MAG: CsbD family protein [Actinomycetota bacterium]